MCVQLRDGGCSAEDSQLGVPQDSLLQSESVGDDSHVWDFLAAGWHMLTRSLLLQVRPKPSM